MGLEDVGQQLPKLQGRIHIEKGDEDLIAQELVSRGVYVWTKFSEVAVFRGEKVLNGLLGVPKPSCTTSGNPVLRLILNFI